MPALRKRRPRRMSKLDREFERLLRRAAGLPKKRRRSPKSRRAHRKPGAA